MKATELLRFPEELKRSQRWVVWKYVTRGEKTTKLPYQPNGKSAESNNPNTWSTFGDAIAASELKPKRFEGVGCMISDPYVAIDFDHVRDPKTGEVEKWAWDAIVHLNSYTELSPSGSGFHVWCYGKVSGAGKRKGRIELYASGRYFTVTGEREDSLPATVNELPDGFYTSIETLDPQYKSSIPSSEIKNERITPAQKWYLLQQGNWKDAGYPSQSEADCAYCVKLAEIFKGDIEKIDAAFRKCPLMREKWDAKRGPDTYGNMTIARALVNFKHQAIEELDWEDAEDTEEQVIDWLWRGKVALGKLCIITGYMDMMKSTIADDIVARLRLQLPWGDGTKNVMPPSGSIILCTEEDYADTRKPRLRAAGLKTGEFRNNIFFIRGVKITMKDDQTTRNLGLLSDCSKLRALLERFPHIKLIVFDPLSDYYGADKSENSNQEVRQVLKPLTDLLAEFQVAGIGIAHFGKNVNVKAAQKTLGSTAIMAVARIGWGCVRADDGNKDHRIMSCVKGNILKARTGLLYESESVNVSWMKQGEEITTEMWRVKWLSEDHTDIDDKLEKDRESNTGELKQCEKWLKSFLHDGKKLVGECKRAGRDEGFNDATITRASRELELKKSNEGKQFFWALDSEPSTLF